MNKHYILALLDPTVRTVSVSFNGSFKSYTYKTRLELAVGDKVVVDTPQNGLQVVPVTAVHELPELDPGSATDYKWIVAKVDLTEYAANVESDAAKFKEVNAARIRHHREQVRAQLVNELPFLQTMVENAAASEMVVNEAYVQEGFTAHGQGAKPEDNPYPAGTRRSDEWIHGYREAVRAKSKA